MAHSASRAMATSGKNKHKTPAASEQKIIPMYSMTKMDSYDEVHDVKSVRNIETPPDNSVDLDLDVSSAIRFIQSADDEKNLPSNEVKYSFLLSHWVRSVCVCR
jgi:hypothetical protein